LINGWNIWRRFAKITNIMTRVKTMTILISSSCGFADFGHFSHRYKDAFGTSPREDRARMRSSGCQS
jgi:transcriptional regulator GlxA family with amidase domain